MESYSRSRVLKIEKQQRIRLVNGTTGAVVNDSLSAGGIYDVGYTLDGFKNPLWRDQIRQHRNAGTPATGTSYHYDPGYTDQEWRVTGPFALPDVNQKYGKSFLAGGVSFPALPASSVNNSALIRFLTKANSEINQANGMQFLGELRKAVHSLKHPFATLVSTVENREIRLNGRWNRIHKVRQSKRKFRKDLWHFKNVASDTWLETQFHVRPLVSDIEDVATYLLSRQHQLEIEYIKVTGVGRSFTSVDSYGTENVYGSNNSKYTVLTRSETRGKVRYKGELKVDPLNTYFDWRDAKNLGFSLRQFAPTLWEITPWSFLVDYFVKFGELIDCFNVPRESIAWINKTERSETKRIQSVSRPASPIVENFNGHVGRLTGFSYTPGYHSATRWKRTQIDPYLLPRPNIRFDLPNGTKLVNMFALAASRSKSRFSNPL